MAPLPPSIPFVKSSGISSLLGASGTSALTGAMSALGGPIGIGASLASAVIPSLLGGNKGPGFRQQINNARTAQHKQIMGHFASIKKAGKTYGYHPLAMLGVNPSSGPSVSLDQGVADNMGQNIGRVAQGFAEKIANLQVDRMQLENSILETQLTNINGQQQQNDRVITVPDEQIAKKANDAGQTAGSHAAFKEYTLGDGYTIELPFSDEGPSESIENMPLPLKYLKTFEMIYKRATAKGQTPTAWAKKYNMKKNGKIIKSKREFEQLIRKLQNRFRRK